MIGIYGGTFDPVHYGHLRTALEVKELFGLDEVRLIPCSQPAHRETPATSAEMRCQMLSLAVHHQPDLIVDRRELDREGYSYMIDTLKSLRTDFPNQPLLLFMGTDAFDGLTAWRQWQQLFDYAHIVVISRPSYQKTIASGFLKSKLTEDYQQLKQQQAGCLFFQTVTQLDISATVIRGLIKSARNPSYLLPNNVIEYIAKNRLYKT